MKKCVSVHSAQTMVLKKSIILSLKVVNIVSCLLQTRIVKLVEKAVAK
jgi:hypothetical protein